jgi:DNA-binding MarR family transcriptional regulator
VKEDRLASQPLLLNPRSKQNLRLWLKLLSYTTIVKRGIATLLKKRCGTTLPRFDFMAELYRSDEVLTMGDISHLLMVSNGNVTGLAAQLERDGLIRRWQLPNDRRTYNVALTDKGRQVFEAAAHDHEQWMSDYMTALDDDEVETLIHLLDKLKQGQGKR